jgi:hypothetical protein
MLTRLEIFKDITSLFNSADYATMKNAVLKYFTIADSFEVHESNLLKRFLYLVYLLTLFKLNERSEAISSDKDRLMSYQTRRSAPAIDVGLGGW